MNMSGKIRVKTDRRYKILYNELKNFALKDMHELFFLCACIGYKAKKRKPLVKNSDDRFWSDTITPDEYACFYAMVTEENNMDFLAIKDDKAVIARMEEYANGGMEVLIKEFLSDYVVKSGDEFKIDTSISKELPKVFLNFIYEQIVESI